MFSSPTFPVSIGRSHSMSRHKPRIPSEMFNMCDFYANMQVFIAKAGIVFLALVPVYQKASSVLLTHVWKPG